MKQRYCPKCRSPLVVLVYEDWEVYWEGKTPKIRMWNCLDCGHKFKEADALQASIPSACSIIRFSKKQKETK